jgi:hypothetical protein
MDLRRTKFSSESSFASLACISAHRYPETTCMLPHLWKWQEFVSQRCFLLRKGADGVTDRPLAICLVIDGAAGQNLQRGRSRTNQPVAQKVHLVLVELVSGAICQVLSSQCNWCEPIYKYRLNLVR